MPLFWRLALLMSAASGHGAVATQRPSLTTDDNYLFEVAVCPTCCRSCSVDSVDIHFVNTPPLLLAVACLPATYDTGTCTGIVCRCDCHKVFEIPLIHLFYVKISHKLLTGAVNFHMGLALIMTVVV